MDQWHIRKNKKIQLEKLSEFLNVKPESLVLSHDHNDEAPVNESLAAIAQFSHYQMYFVMGSWAEYAQMLSLFKPEELNSSQRGDLYTYLGMAQAFSFQFNKSKKNLEKGLELSEFTKNQPRAMLACELLSAYHCFNSNFETALDYAKRIETYSFEEAPDFFKAFPSYKIGWIMTHTGELESAEDQIKQSIHIFENSKQKLYALTLHAYAFLAQIYLRQRRTNKAAQTFKKLISLSKTFGWPRGILIATLGLEATKILKGIPLKSQKNIYGKIKNVNKIHAINALGAQFTMYEFFCRAYSGDYAGARELNTHRKEPFRENSLFSAYITLDNYFLDRLEETSHVSSAEIKKAIATFSKNNMSVQLNILNTLQNIRVLDRKDFVNIYPF